MSLGAAPGYGFGFALAASMGAPMLTAASVLGVDAFGSLHIPSSVARLVRAIVLLGVVGSAAFVMRRTRMREVSWARTLGAVFAYLLIALSLAIMLSRAEVGDGREWLLFYFLPSLGITSVFVCPILIALARRSGPAEPRRSLRVSFGVAASILVLAATGYLALKAVASGSAVRVVMPLAVIPLASVVLLAAGMSPPREDRGSRLISTVFGAGVAILLGAL